MPAPEKRKKKIFLPCVTGTVMACVIVGGLSALGAFLSVLNEFIITAAANAGCLLIVNYRRMQ